MGFPEPQPADWRDRTATVFTSQGFMTHLGVTLEILGPGHVVLRLPHDQSLTQQSGFFHGGLIATLADTSGGIACHTLRALDDVMTVEFKLNMIRPGAGSLLLAEATVLRCGKTISVARMDLFVEREGQKVLCAAGQGTFISIPKPAPH